MENKKIVFTSLEDILLKVTGDSRLFSKIYDELSAEEKLYIKDLIKEKSCLNCQNPTCRISNSEKLEDDEPCIGWENKEMVGKYKVLELNKKGLN